MYTVIEEFDFAMQFNVHRKIYQFLDTKYYIYITLYIYIYNIIYATSCRPIQP